MLSSNTTEERFNSTRRAEGRDLYLTEITSDIGEFSHLIDCHGVCGNSNVVSFVTNLLVESVFGKIKMQFFMCLVVSSSRLLFTFHVFSFKWVLISILIWNAFVEHQNRKKSTTEHAKLGLVKNCLNSIMRWLANVTIFLLFTRTFETWYSCFSRNWAKVYYTIPLFSDTLGQCALEISGIKLNIWGIMEKERFFQSANYYFTDKQKLS